MDGITGVGSIPLAPPFCTVVAVDTSSYSYLACATCEKPLSDGEGCSTCSLTTAAPARLYRVLLSVATAGEVTPVICFDRAARTLFGCSAADFFHFSEAHPSAPEKAAEILRGEMCRMTFGRSRSGSAQHLRVVSVVPLRTGFRPVIEALRANISGS